MTWPIQLIQTKGRLVMMVEYPMDFRIIHTDGRPHQKDPDPTFNGDSVAHWEGDTLVIDVTGFNDRTWLDRAGNFHSDALHVVERYTARSRNIIDYEATIEDPNVFSRPWKIRMPLYRHVEENAHLLEYQCIPYAEDVVYGHLRHKEGDSK